MTLREKPINATYHDYCTDTVEVIKDQSEMINEQTLVYEILYVQKSFLK